MNITFESQELNIKATPMMVQWHSCKKKAGDALLLFRMGDFYEAFYDDAITLAKEADLTLTKRQGIPMSGIPYHTAENYIEKLVGKGMRVAIAEQMEDPKTTKGLVKREIVRIVTPASFIPAGEAQPAASNYFVSLCQVASVFGMAVLELSTGEFKVMETEEEHELWSELYRLQPKELLISEKLEQKYQSKLGDFVLSFSLLITNLPDWTFDHKSAFAVLTNQFKVHSLDGFGMKGLLVGINAAGALLSFIKDNLNHGTDHIAHITLYSTKQFVGLDRITLRNLEVVESLCGGNKKNTLLEVLDYTKTPMGSRLIRQWLLQPLQNVEEIKERQNSISTIHTAQVLSALTEQLLQIRDLERLMMRICSGLAGPKDLGALKNSLEQVLSLKEIVKPLTAPLLQKIHLDLEDPYPLLTLLTKALVNDPPVKLGDGQTFQTGYHLELDHLRSLVHDNQSWLVRYQEELKTTTGIKTLRVGYTQVFGYYIEVSKGQADKMPPSFHRRQTLTNAERFMTPELKEYENQVLSAQDRHSKLEAELFAQLKQELSQYTPLVLSIAKAIAHLDCLQSLAQAAKQWQYTCPVVDEGGRIEIIQGRHPVIEACILGGTFTPNDTLLDDAQHRLLLITGPNMAGKSTYIRQVALITLMAHIGSYVPAGQARIAIRDKIFTRIGASDDLSRGQSTFMVEMTETANILNNATDRSLVILDEIGRGTSTYDGISIAWAVAEALLTKEGKRAKTLFATHYWELTKLEEHYPGAINYTTMVQEMKDDVLFLHKIVRGGTDKSYGIHVARLAGLPLSLIHRAKEILAHLEENAARKDLFTQNKSFAKLKKKEPQLPLFEEENPLLAEAKLFAKELSTLDLNHLSPMQAHQKLAEYQLKWHQLVRSC